MGDDAQADAGGSRDDVFARELAAGEGDERAAAGEGGEEELAAAVAALVGRVVALEQT